MGISRHQILVTQLVRNLSQCSRTRIHSTNSNNLTEAKILVPNSPPILTWYSCGPTVYASSHLGHATTFIRQDTIRRLLHHYHPQWNILLALGITNIDDKIINVAHETKTSWDQIVAKFESLFFTEMDMLGIQRPNIILRVSDHLDTMISFIASLVSKKLAYVVGNSVYFDVEGYSKSKKYGKLRNLKSTSSDDFEQDAKKKNSKDFVLWKGRENSSPFEPVWPSPWGTGRPGWHIECSAMSTKVFGSKLDIHSGGWDLIFPHHENEEAQCCAYLDTPYWAEHWLHFGHLHFAGDEFKMSKSRGNYLSIEEFLKSYKNGSQVLRMFTLQSHYRSPLNFSSKAMEHSANLLSKFKYFVEDCSAVLSGVKAFEPKNVSWEDFKNVQINVDDALNNDFDTAKALDFLIKFVSHVNNDFKGESTDYGLVLAMQSYIKSIFRVVGINLDKKVDVAQQEDNQMDVIEELIAFRNAVRDCALGHCDKKSLLSLCDGMRDKLNDWGVHVRDQNQKIVTRQKK